MKIPKVCYGYYRGIEDDECYRCSFREKCLDCEGSKLKKVQKSKGFSSWEVLGSDEEKMFYLMVTALACFIIVVGILMLMT